MVRTVDVRPDDVTLDLEALRRDPPRAAEPCRVRLGIERRRHDQPGLASSPRGAHEAGALTFVDAVHAAPHLPIDVQAIGTDFLACSVYKFFGPHVGVLYGRRAALAALPTYMLRLAHDRFETGTLNYEGIAGRPAAVEYIADVGRTVRCCLRRPHSRA